MWRIDPPDMNKLTIVKVPDGSFEALYVNGKLFDHSIKITIEDIMDYKKHIVPIESINQINWYNFDSSKAELFPKNIENLFNV